MTWILIGTGLLLAFLYYGRTFVSADPKTLARYARHGGALALILVGAFLITRGVAIVGGPLVLLGLGTFLPGLRIGGRSPSGGGESQIRTDWVHMRLDRATGAIEGDVKRGAFAGRRLADLDEGQVRAVLAEAQVSDRDAAALLDAYIQRRFGPSAGGGARTPAQPQGAMSEDEALAILGLPRGASEDEIRAAHKRLMVKVHPDQGGSGWLATKLNAARERLVGKG